MREGENKTKTKTPQTVKFHKGGKARKNSFANDKPKQRFPNHTQSKNPKPPLFTQTGGLHSGANKKSTCKENQQQRSRGKKEKGGGNSWGGKTNWAKRLPRWLGGGVYFSGLGNSSSGLLGGALTAGPRGRSVGRGGCGVPWISWHKEIL